MLTVVYARFGGKKVRIDDSETIVPGVKDALLLIGYEEVVFC